MGAHVGAAERAQALFERTFSATPDVVVRAPGRVNLIGEHTDYNDGFVLPMALPYDTVIAAQVVGGRVVTVHSEGFGAARFDLDDDPGTTVRWARYLHGMAAVLEQAGNAIGAWEGAIATDIPAGASLSSSAALEVAGGLTFAWGTNAAADLVGLARFGRQVENEIMGLPSGIMDQLASATAVAGCASLIDCRDLSVRAVPLPPNTVVVVMDTGTRRELVDSAYADRQRACRRAADAIGIASLREATVADLPGIDDAITARRARHVIEENARTLAAAAAMAAGDGALVGRLMHESHTSLRDLYEVSGPALDRIVAVAADAPGCLGARMTGGGFAGGAVALVDAHQVDAFTDAVLLGYSTPAEQPAVAPTRLHPVTAAAGAGYLT